jgi:gliding motility-associated-like protein
MKNRFIFLLLLFLNFQLYGQLQNHLWFFGPANLGMKFSNPGNSISVITNKYSPFTYEGCSVACNPKTGKLLFYTDGIVIVDSTNTVMPNASSLSGNNSAGQSGLTCVVPGTCSLYYVFSNNSTRSSGNIYYSIVDMNLPGNGTVSAPLGDVKPGFKNVLLTNNAGEALAIIPSDVAEKYFLVYAPFNSSLIKVYEISASGITYKNTFNTNFLLSDGRNMRYSPVNKKIVLMSLNENDPVVIVDFDIVNGNISNSTKVSGTPFPLTGGAFNGVYDAEWSPDGFKLYLSKYTGKLYQYDLNNPANSPILIYDNGGSNHDDPGEGLRVGPDGKMYWLYQNTTYSDNRFIGVVSNPNLTGLSCNFNSAGFNIGQNIIAVKFPDTLVYSNILLQQPDIKLNCVREPIIIDIPNASGNDISIVEVSSGTAQVLPNQTIQYTPLSNFKNNDTIIYSLQSTDCPFITNLPASILLDVNTTIPIQAPDIKLSCVRGSIIINIPNASGNNISIIKVSSGTAQVLSDQSIQYVPLSNFKNNDTIIYSIQAIGCPLPAVLSDSIFLEVNNMPVIIPNLFTPNNDSLNDKFEITGSCLASYIEIYNIWGELIYKNSNYNNDWNAEGFPDGMYFYYYIDSATTDQYKGWVHILR